MARYLIVANRTAQSPELVERIEKLAAEDSGAEFVLLVPAAPAEHLHRLTWTEGESRALAMRNAEAAKARLQATGARVIEALVGDASPVWAIEDELRRRPSYYQALIFSTFPPGISRWLKFIHPSWAQRKFNLPIIHVTAFHQPKVDAVSSGERLRSDRTW